MTAPPAGSLPDATKLAIDRTRLAHERTLMAWVRTSTSLISFGFTIYKFFQYLRESQPPTDRAMGPRGFALMMILIGITALVLATVEHRHSMVQLRAEYGMPQPRSLAMILAFMIAALGVTGLLLVAFHQ